MDAFYAAAVSGSNITIVGSSPTSSSTTPGGNDGSSMMSSMAFSAGSSAVGLSEPASAKNPPKISLAMAPASKPISGFTMAPGNPPGPTMMPPPGLVTRVLGTHGAA